MRQTTLSQSGALGRVMAGPISLASIQYMDFVKIFNVSLDLSTTYFFILVGVELRLYF